MKGDEENPETEVIENGLPACEPGLFVTPSTQCKAQTQRMHAVGQTTRVCTAAEVVDVAGPRGPLMPGW